MSIALALCALLLPASDGPESIPLAGVVVDGSGTAVEGAEILISGLEYPQPKIFARAKTDRDGKFRVEIAAEATTASFEGHANVWARPPRGRLAWQTLKLAESPKQPLRLVCGDRSDIRIQIVDSDEKPVARAKVRALTVRTGSPAIPFVLVPEELSIALAATTDERGIAELPGVAADGLMGVRVETAQFGIQQFGIQDESAKLDKLSLLGVGRLVGKLTGGEAKAAAGTTIDIRSFQGEPGGVAAAGIQAMGFARVTLDESGRFEVPALAAGRLHLQVQPIKDSAFRLQPPTDVIIREGKETLAEIPLRRMIRVRGVVRERGSGKPIAGANVTVVSNNVTSEVFKTDEQGKFTGSVMPGSLRTHVFAVPPPYIAPVLIGGQQVEVAESKGEHEFEPIELLRGGSVRGKVVNEKGEPVVGAGVSAQWTLRDGNFAAPRTNTAKTDERGEFLLDGVDPSGELRLSATLGDESMIEPTVARVAANEPVVLRLSAAANIATAGRIVDRAGKPVAGAAIEIWSQSRAPEGHVIASSIVQFDGKRSLTTDSDGKFQTPRQLKRGSEYRAIVRNAGMLPGKTEWLKFADAGSAKFPDVVLGRLRAIEGRVLDSDGRPVAGATVLQSGDGPQRTQARSDNAGRFRLDGLPDEPAFVFVEKTGFRFHGQPVDSSSSSVDLEIRRVDQPAARALSTLPGALDRDESLRLARQVLAPYAERAVANGSESDKLRVLEVVARVDPARIVDTIEKNGFSNPWNNDYLRRAVVRALLKDSPDEALAVVESMQDASWRATGLTDAADALPVTERARKLELLAQALLNARNVQDPAHRLHHMGGIAERWLDMGEIERATQLLREGEKVARELPNAAFAGYSRGGFAEELAQIDLDAALELTKDLSDKYEYDRHHGNIAHELAAKRPADAERILAMMREPFQRDRWAPRVCYRMAPVDLQRARGIAEKIIDREMKAFAYGVMAQAWAQRDKAQAAKLLNESFDQLAAGVASSGDRPSRYPWTNVAAAILPVAEQIDPELVPQFLWRAVSFRLPRPQEHDLQGSIELTDATLALVVARYDRTLARTIFAPVAENLPALVKAGPQFGRGLGPIFAAAAVIDPHAAIKLLERLPDDPGLAFHTPKNSARITIADTLALTDKNRWRNLSRHLQLWIVDNEDL